MADVSEWQPRKTEAETALHRLMTGAAVAEITGPDGSRTSFTPATMDQLQKYLNFCEQQIEQAQRGFRRPIYFIGGR